MNYLMGIDIGTSSVKVMICDLQGNEIATKSNNEYNIISNQDNYAEQDMKLIYKSTIKAMKTLLDNIAIDKKLIKAISFSGQMHGLVMLDKDGKLLNNAIIWADSRSLKQADLVNQLQLESKLFNKCSPGFLFASLLWVKEKQPDVYKKIDKVLLPKDYIRYCFTNHIATDYTDASSTGVFDMENKTWSKEILDYFGISSRIFPEINYPETYAGNLNTDISLALGLSNNIKVFYGGGDHLMQSLGNGLINPGTLCSNIGTASQISTIVDQAVYDSKLRTNTFQHVSLNHYSLLDACLNGGIALDWFNQSFDLNLSYEDINQYVDEINCGSNDLIFLPYLLGERSPIQDPNAKGMLFGLTLNHNYKHVFRAIMEGIVFALYDCLMVFNG